MKDCPDCWHEVTDIDATECEVCGCKFVKLIANDSDWEESLWQDLLEYSA